MSQKGDMLTEGTSILQAGRKFIFGIGINDYKHWRPLRNAVKDLDDLVDVLLERYDFDPSRLKLLKNEEATRKNIINTLHNFTYSTELGADDSLLIYFSGHGHLDTNEDGYWVPVESEPGDIDSFIPNVVLQSIIKSVKCRHVLLISDSCFSGSMLSRGSTVFHDGVVAEDLESKKSRWIITSGGRDETVLDGAGANSPFAEAILSELRHNPNPRLLADKLALSVRDITRTNASQMPQAEKLGGAGDLGGRFVFYLRDREADDWQAALAKNSVEVFELFRNQYPGSIHVAEVAELVASLNEKTAWERACQVDTAGEYDSFIEKHPQSKYLGIAYQKLEEAEDRRDWHRALRIQTIVAFREYRAKHPEGQYTDKANSQIATLHQLEETERFQSELEMQQSANEIRNKQEEIQKVENTKREDTKQTNDATKSGSIQPISIEINPEALVKSPQSNQDFTTNTNDNLILVAAIILVLVILGIILYPKFSGKGKKAEYSTDISSAALDTIRINTSQAQFGIDSAKSAFDKDDYKTAFRLFTKYQTASEFDAWSAFELGYIYHQGYGVKKNYIKATLWYRMAADQGIAAAQNNLGAMYSSGEGVKQNYIEAVKWFQKAVDQGDATAQNNLAKKYENGTGVVENIIEAIRLYRLAANQGNQDAKDNLKRLGY